jgi:hypothetical protein
MYIILKFVAHGLERRAVYIAVFFRLRLVATGHQVAQQTPVAYLQVLKLIHLHSLGITDMTGGGINVHMTAYEQQRSQMTKKIQLLFLVRLDPRSMFLSLDFLEFNIQYAAKSCCSIPTFSEYFFWSQLKPSKNSVLLFCI